MAFEDVLRPRGLRSSYKSGVLKTDSMPGGVVLAVGEDQDSMARVFVKQGVEVLDELLQLVGLERKACFAWEARFASVPRRFGMFWLSLRA